MNNDKIYSGIKEWFDSDKNLNKGMKLHTQHSKSHANKMRLAKQPLKRKNLLPIYLKEIMNNHRPDGVDIQESDKKTESEKVEKKRVKSVSIKLQEEFPFLKFNDLPSALQLLVLKRYQKWEEGKLAYAEQQDTETDNERFLAAKNTVLSTKENWDIWAELDHFQRFGKILGKHPQFEENVFLAEIKQLEQLPAVECTKELTRIRVNRRNAINRLLNINKKKGISEKQKSDLKQKISEFDVVSIKLSEPEWVKD